jgi:quercetin dioxygenase-like cupin family protein
LLERIRNIEDDIVGNYVPGKYKTKARATLIRRTDLAYEIVGEQRPIRVAIGISTTMLTTGFVDLYPGQKSEVVSHPGDKVLYVLEGQLNIHLPDNDGEWWELVDGDTAFIPSGCRHVFFNTSDALTEFLFSVAPLYR